VYGGVGLFADALGMTEKEFFKAMEAGSLMTADVLPKLTKQMKMVARENGALDKAMQSVNSEQQRFNTNMALAKKEIFDGGFGEGMADFFGSLSSTIKNSLPALRFFGAMVKGMLSMVTSAIQIVLTPLELLSKLFQSFDLKGLGSVIGAGGSLFLLAWHFKAIRNLVLGLNSALLVTMQRVLMVATPLLALEDLAAAYLGKDSLTGRVSDTISRDNILSSSMNNRINDLLKSINPNRMDININTQGVENLIDVKVGNSDSNTRANALAQLGG
jgi:hypothetical protein